MQELPRIRAHERIDFKRCPKKWFWHWRKGLVPKSVSFGALDLGTWVHKAAEIWYDKGYKRVGNLAHIFGEIAEESINLAAANSVPENEIDKACTLALLGEEMCKAYEKHYGNDPDVYVIDAEVPLDFVFPDEDGNPAAIHMLKPDLVYAHQGRRNRIRLMENKTAASIRTEHLTIDDQAKPYGVMAERALKQVGLLGKADRLEGITYNFFRKALPDTRPRDAQGRCLNKNGTVSAKQPNPLFVRKLITLTKEAKAQALHEIRKETLLITGIADMIRRREHVLLLRTAHHSCPRFCQYFPICDAEANGKDIRGMIKDMYRVEDPYVYEESTEEPVSFEMG